MIYFTLVYLYWVLYILHYYSLSPVTPHSSLLQAVHTLFKINLKYDVIPHTIRNTLKLSVTIVTDPSLFNPLLF